jgi:hypothetical protein
MHATPMNLPTLEDHPFGMEIIPEYRGIGGMELARVIAKNAAVC